MKKILGLSIAALALIGLVAGSTLAYFTDVEESPNNVFTAGTIDLAINNQNPWNQTLFADSGADWKPCQAAEVSANVTNVGTNPMDVWIRFKDVQTSTGSTGYSCGTASVSSEPECYAEGGPANHSPIDNIDTKISVRLVLGNKSIDYGTLYLNTISGSYIYLGVLNPNTEWNGTLGLKIDCNTGNAYQGDRATFTIEFFAQQSEGTPQPPAPTPELPGYGR